MWKEFKPAFRFLLIFLGLYLGGNIVYGIWIEWYGADPDFATRAVAFQTAHVLDVIGYDVNAVVNTQGPTVFLRNDVKTILNIYEGCNGLNVIIVFVSFLIAFGGDWKRMRWFLPLGLLIIHFANIIRLALLYFVAVNFQHYFYYVHKYVFTAAIYIVVILLWAAWIGKINGQTRRTITT